MLRLHARQEQGMWLPIGDHVLKSKLRDARGLYDFETVEAALAEVKQHRTAVDAGAHIGMITKQLAGKFRDVLAFEPDRRMYEFLGWNMEQIGNVRRFPIALGSETKRARLSHDGVNHNSCGFIDHVGDPGRNWSLVLPLDAFGMADVDLIKIDVEGGECDVIDGAAQTIERCRPVVVIEENWCATRYGRQPGAAREKLSAMGMIEKARVRFQSDSENVIMAWPAVERLS